MSDYTKCFTCGETVKVGWHHPCFSKPEAPIDRSKEFWEVKPEALGPQVGDTEYYYPAAVSAQLKPEAPTESCPACSEPGNARRDLSLGKTWRQCEKCYQEWFTDIDYSKPTKDSAREWRAIAEDRLCSMRKLERELARSRSYQADSTKRITLLERELAEAKEHAQDLKKQWMNMRAECLKSDTKSAALVSALETFYGEGVPWAIRAAIAKFKESK